MVFRVVVAKRVERVDRRAVRVVILVRNVVGRAGRAPG